MCILFQSDKYVFDNESKLLSKLTIFKDGFNFAPDQITASVGDIIGKYAVTDVSTLR